MKKTYWKGLDEKDQSPEFVQNSNKEFREDLSIDEFIGSEAVGDFQTGRRDFLKFLGFGVAAATLASCETPVIKSIPYVNKPEEVTPGVANWYASTFYDGNDYANILVKAREGRPIWIKGNKYFGTTGGGITSRIGASVLNLYNNDRLRGPVSGGSPLSWTDADSAIKSKLKSIADRGGKVRILSNTIISPSTKLVIDEFIGSIGGEVDEIVPTAQDSEVIGADISDQTADVLPASSNSADVKHIQYDAVSYSAIRKANEESFGKSVIPAYDFSRARAIVSIDADFIGNWLMHSRYNVDYGKTRKPESGWMSRHFHFESVMSLTGANADSRCPIKPSEQVAVAAAILKHVGGKDLGFVVSDRIDVYAAKAADKLKEHRGESLVVAGANDKAVQVIVNSINNELNNYGKTIDLDNEVYIKQADDTKVEELVNDVIGGGVDALLIYGANPVYTLPNGAGFGEALANVELSISFSEFADETASKCTYICPDHNYLESWNDYKPQVGQYSIQQPVIRPLFDSRQAQESLLVWTGNAEREDKESKTYYNFIQDVWRRYRFPMQSEYLTFDEYWNWSVHNGSSGGSAIASTAINFTDTTSAAASSIKSSDAAWEVVAYQKGAIGEGQYTANPWLQELPDSITKVCWDNYVTMAPADCYDLFNITGNEKGKWDGLYIEQETPVNMVNVTVGEQVLKLPVYPLPGQARGTVGIALGYGRAENQEAIGSAAFQIKLDQTGDYDLDADGKKKPIGGNSYKFTSFVNGSIKYYADADVADANEKYFLACTQTHHTIMGRTSIFRETDLDTVTNGNKEDYNPAHELHVHTKGHGEHVNATDVSLWEEHPVEFVGHRWGMSVDLTSCNGCGVCIVACHSENNVPVVGKDEIRRARDMHWLRMDRYFSSIDDDARARWQKDKRAEGNDWSYANLEVPEDNPTVAFMPMMCQHCNHAPCETVCPVAATTHSNEGLNMMAYNRCIGTRYCGNNCPYKVRRFNWFNYRDYRKFKHVNSSQDEMARMVLNPDVTVRSRGVMEKCSFCIQSIQEAKLTAKKESRVLVDGDIKCACGDACPNDCITFGDWNDESSEVRRLTDPKAENAQADRAYQALEEIGVKPNVWYQVKVRNVEESAEVAHADAGTEGHS
jgi:molybdopterin-containing oxidoreductase family iron-sulfur binding subunit